MTLHFGDSQIEIHKIAGEVFVDTDLASIGADMERMFP